MLGTLIFRVNHVGYFEPAIALICFWERERERVSIYDVLAFYYQTQTRIDFWCRWVWISSLLFNNKKLYQLSSLNQLTLSCVNKVSTFILMYYLSIWEEFIWLFFWKWCKVIINNLLEINVGSVWIELILLKLKTENTVTK